MALRIREDGRILCAALHEAMEGDTYIPEGISEVLSGATGGTPVITTDTEPVHSTHGQWWWVGQSRPRVQPIVVENINKMVKLAVEANERTKESTVVFKRGVEDK